MKRIRSKTFAVLLMEGERLGAYFLARQRDEDTDTRSPFYLDIEPCKTTWGRQDQNNLIMILVAAGIAVRFFDEEERQWMQLILGGEYIQVSGNRDGSWGVPSLEDFERDYLGR